MSNINVAIADDNERIRQNLQEIISKEKDRHSWGVPRMVLTLCL